MTALAAAQSCTLVAKPNPFSSERMFASIPAGQSLAEMIGPDASHSLSIQVGGRDVPRALWTHTRPKPGQTIHAVNFPQGGNGGKYARLALTLVLMYFTYGTTGWASSLAGASGNAAAWGAGIMMVGTLQGAALIPQGVQP